MTDVPISPALARVVRGDLCAGCGLCAGIAPDRIALAEMAPGFPRPRQLVPLTTAQEAAIAATCPGLGQKVEPAGRRDDVLWGPWIEAVTGWSTDPDLRHAGASGGGISGLLLHLLESGRVDAVVQIMADRAVPHANATVITTDREGILASAGSRYAPSSPLAGLSGWLADGRRFAFVGKPCDAAALRALAGRDAAVARTFPVILSFFCGGMPSHAGGRAVLAALGVKPEEVASFRFRGNGWPGRATAGLKDGSERSMSYPDSWGGILSKHVQHRCRICADGTGTAADLVCADAWEADAKGYPRFGEAPGISLILARTALGAEILAEVRAAGRIEARPFDMGHLAAIQPGQRERRRAILARLAGLWLLGRPIPRYEGLQLRAAARQAPPAKNLRNFLGMIRRTLRPRRT